MADDTTTDPNADYHDPVYDEPGSTSPVSLDYWRAKATEFQGVMNQLDASIRAARAAIAADIDPELTADLQAYVDDYESRAWTFRATAEAINAGAAIVNAAGGRFPQLSVPSGLGFLPAIPLATVAALGTAAALIVWGAQVISGINDRLKRAADYAAIEDPAKRAELARAVALSDAAQNVSLGSGLVSLAGAAKWGAIAFAVYLAWQAWQGSQRGD